MLKLLLFLSLLLLFYSLTVGQFPDKYKIKNKILPYLMQVTSAMIIFLLTSLLFKSPLPAIFWALLGWFLPDWITNMIKKQKQQKIKNMAKNFITSSAGLFSAGQMTSEVIRTMSMNMPEPLASEFADMIRIRNMNPNASYQRMFMELANKYDVQEFEAVSEIIAASQQAGGPKATARGLKRLGKAIRQKDRLKAEREKAIMEPKIAAYVVILLLTIGILLDVTAFSDLFTGGGKLVLTLSSGLIVGMIFLAKKTLTSEDLN